MEMISRKKRACLRATHRQAFRRIKGRIVLSALGTVLMSFLSFPVMSFGETEGSAKQTEDRDAEPMVAAQQDEVNYTFGMTVKVAADQITLSELDYEGEKEIEHEVTYMVSDETVFENFNSMDEIASDEEVEVFYSLKNGQKMAVAIAKMDIYEWDDEEIEGSAEQEGEDLDIEAVEIEQELLGNKIP